MGGVFIIFNDGCLPASFCWCSLYGGLAVAHTPVVNHDLGPVRVDREAVDGIVDMDAAQKIAQQFRAVLLENCNLSTRTNTRKYALNLITPVGSVQIDDAYRPSCFAVMIVLRRNYRAMTCCLWPVESAAACVISHPNQKNCVNASAITYRKPVIHG